MGGSKTTTKTEEAKLPAWLKPYYTEMARRSGKLSRQNFVPYEGRKVAGRSPLELEAQRGIMSMARAGDRPEHQFGLGQLHSAAGAIENMPLWSQKEYERYASPFFENVVDITKRGAMRDYGILSRKLASKAAQSGAYGGSREAVMQSSLARDAMQNLGDIEARGRQGAFESAMGAFERGRSERIGATTMQSQIAQQAMQMASQKQTEAFQRLSMLEATGATDRQLEQAAIQLAMQQHEAEQGWERALLQQHTGNILGIRTGPIGTSHSTSVEPGPSVLGQVLGGITGAVGMATGLGGLFGLAGAAVPKGT